MEMREFHWKENTIGTRPCEISLNKILLAIGDPYIAQKTMKHYYRFKDGVKTISQIKDRKIAMPILEAWKKYCFDLVDKTEKITKNKDLYSHLKCCMVGSYRENLK